MSGGYTAIVIELPDDDGVVQIKRVTAKGDDFLGQAVGGWIEHLATEDGKTDFWVNEEGKIHGLPVNFVATDVLRALYPWRPEQVWPGGPGEPFMVGNVVLTGNRGPETASVPDGVWERLQAMAGPTGVWTIHNAELPVWLGPVAFTDEREK
jgi:hypothetical protein